MRNVGSSETSQELAVDTDEPVVQLRPHKSSEEKRSVIEVVEPKKRSAVEERPAVQPRHRLQPKQRRRGRGKRVGIIVSVLGILALAFLAWKYVLPFLR